MSASDLTHIQDALALADVRFSRSDEDLASDFATLQRLLVKWQKVQNLVAGDSLSAYWTRHVTDSLQLVSFLPVNAQNICDLGSGGGFPALPMAIALKDKDIHFTLVESNSRKVAFLRAVSREMQLKVTVVDARIEEFVSRETARFDVFTARALASLIQLCGFVHPIWGDKTVAIFPKGREHVEEITESGARWLHDVLIHPSKVDQSGVVLELTNLRR